MGNDLEVLFICENMKDTFYFPHDYNASSDEKITKLVRIEWREWYGIYRHIIEKLANNDGKLSTDSIEDIAYAMHLECERIANVLRNYDLFVFEDDFFYSNRLMEHINIRNNKKDLARKSAEVRRSNANALPTHSERNAKERKVKEIKVKESKEKDIIKDTTIVVATPESFWNSDVNEILEKIKIYNNNIIDWTVKEQRQYWKMLFDKLKQIDSVKNNNYSAAWLLEIILQIISKNEYHSHKIVWPKKIYYELAGLMQICKQEMQKEKKSTVKEF